MDTHYTHFFVDYIHSWDHVWYLHLRNPIEENKQHIAFFKKDIPVNRMREEICCITNKGKTAKDEWENDDSDFQLYTFSIKILVPYFTC